MESIDNVRERLEALEQQMRAMGAHTRTVERRLRWWRGLTGSRLVLSLLSLTLVSGRAAGAQPGDGRLSRGPSSEAESRGCR
jgi:hypothetical protein